ncbi:hypothetical protein PAXRUDRAFT_725132 [Paxillus rubicundulus Ve08.2h10]|uniref:Uncharacterized protein n=1 Tax=Paxillus rubicundulus Ve08.2h10 TaxID=930991 RepID=A0A0D0E2A3_9AGAM|nr:hypothetical protein PAXRUDRAFT_725132 [Paxillus rubicundulus Ve08.2h10]
MHVQWSSYPHHRGRKLSTTESNMGWSTNPLSSPSTSQALTSARVPQGLSSHCPQTPRQSLPYAIERQKPHDQDTYSAISQSYISLSYDTDRTIAQRLYASSLPKPPAALPATLQTRDSPALNAPPNPRPQSHQARQPHQARHSGPVDSSSGVTDVVIISPATIQPGEYQEQDEITLVLSPSGDGFTRGLSQVRGEAPPPFIQHLPFSPLEHHSPHERVTSRQRLSSRVTGPRRPSIRLDSVPEHRNLSSQSPLTHDVHFQSVSDSQQEPVPSYSVVDNTPPPPDFEDNSQTFQIVGRGPGTGPSSSPQPLDSPAALSRAPTYALIDPRFRTSSVPSQHTEDSSSSIPSSSRNNHRFSNRSPSNLERPRNTSTTSPSVPTIHESAAELYGASYSSFPPVRSRPPAAQRPSPHIRPPLALFHSQSSPAGVTPESAVNGPGSAPAIPFPTSESLLDTSHRQGTSMQPPRAISLPALLPPLSANHRPPDPSPTTPSVGSHDFQLPPHKSRKPPKGYSSNTILSHPSGASHPPPQQQVTSPPVPRPTSPNGPYQRGISDISPAPLGSQQVVVQQAQVPQRPSPHPHPPAQHVDVQRATQYPAAPRSLPPPLPPPPNYQLGPPDPRPTPQQPAQHHALSHDRPSHYQPPPTSQGAPPPQTVPPPVASTRSSTTDAPPKSRHTHTHPTPTARKPQVVAAPPSRYRHYSRPAGGPSTSDIADSECSAISGMLEDRLILLTTSLEEFNKVLL